MLRNELFQYALFQRWIDDQKLAFAANEIICGSEATRERALDVVKRISPMVSLSSDTTLLLFSQLPGDVIRLNDELVDRVTTAKETISKLEGASVSFADQKFNHQALAAKGLNLLLQPRMTFARFLRWAHRVSPERRGIAYESPFWHQEMWSAMHASLSNTANAAIAEDSARLFAGISAFDSRIDDRLIAICKWHKSIETLTQNNVPAAITRLALGMVSAQFCWPLMVADTENEGDVTIGISLPMFAWFQRFTNRSDDRSNRVWMRGGNDIRFQRDDISKLHGFSWGGLMLDSEWLYAIDVGLRVGKALWKSQTGRMDDSRVRNSILQGSINVEVSIANQIVSEIYPDRVNHFVLRGRSAEAYWVQVVLGLLLPNQRIPSGVATGLVKGRGNETEFLLGDVDGLRAKLLYASRTGLLSKVIIPATTKSRREVETAINDEAIRFDLTEISACSTARSTADAMQISGWRRATFLGAPEVRSAFSRLLTDFFRLDQHKCGEEKLPPKEAERLEKTVLDRRRAVNNMMPANDRSPIAFMPSTYVNEAKLGHWLACMDNDIRTGNPELAGGPGLGILCLKTRSGESDMRFWANVFDLLEATEAQWEKFQFGSLEESAEAVAELLNNFEANPRVSSAPAPDLFIVLDEARATQGDGRARLFDDDVRGSLYDLLNTKAVTEQERAHHLADALTQRDEVRAGQLMKTRVIVIHPEDELQPMYAEPPFPPMGDAYLDKLRIFRSSFSIHSAHSVLNIGSTKKLEWPEVRQILQDAIGDKKLSYGRGEYYFSNGQQSGRLRPDILFDADLHEVAALSFASFLISGDSVVRARRSASFEPHFMREARWHLHQAITYVKSFTQHKRLRFYLSMLAFINPAQDWDTVSAMEYNRTRFGMDAVQLAKDLLKKEGARGRTPHASRYAQALTTLSKAIRHKSMNFAKIQELYADANTVFLAGISCATREPETQLYLNSEMAFFCQRLLQGDQRSHKHWNLDGTPARGMKRNLTALKNDIEKGLFAEIEKIVQAHAVNSERRAFPVQHGWLEDYWDAGLGMQIPAWQFSYAACATDLAPTVSSWLKLLSYFAAPQNGDVRKDFTRVLYLWHHRVEDKVAFAWRMKHLASDDEEFLSKRTKANVYRQLGSWLGKDSLGKYYLSSSARQMLLTMRAAFDD